MTSIGNRATVADTEGRVLDALSEEHPLDEWEIGRRVGLHRREVKRLLRSMRRRRPSPVRYEVEDHVLMWRLADHLD